VRLEALIRWYEGLTPERLEEVSQLYHEQAGFQDPFNRVRGQAAIRAVFRHMFETTRNPRFRVTDRRVEGDVAWLCWRFDCRLRGRAIAFEGATRLRFGEDGRVLDHRDYWDAADLFQPLPLLGTMVRLVKRRLSLPAGTLAGEEPHP